MLQDKVQEVFNEPGCAKNQAKSEKERKKGCTKALKPGAAAGGCAYDGAMIALQPIADVAHLVHGPIACLGNSWDNRGSKSSGPQTYRMGFTTDLSELDVIHGGEKKLFKAIKEIITQYDPPAVFVYLTCVPSMIGDDVEAVCKHASRKFGKPVIPINAPGFVGSKNLGNKLAGEALLEHVIGTEEPEVSTDTDVCIIGEYNLAGELWQIKPLFDEIGIRLLSCISGDARYHEVARAHRARLTMVVCSQALVNVGRKMEERWGIPYFEGSFYGVSDMSDTLRTMTRMLVERGAKKELIDRAEGVIAREESRVWRRLEPYRARFDGKRVLLFTGGVKSWSMVTALETAGLTIVGTSTKKSTKEDKERIKKAKGKEFHMWDDLKPRDIYKMLRDSEADIMLSGGRSQFISLKAKVPWLDINQERHHAYAGYDGIVALCEEIDKTLSSPIWRQVRLPAPWE
ncbi:nitrogenase iron-molybdenum cofactor biosynthesis protein NifE [Azospirillum sp. RWY-5-1]|uniref:Nitrogenase iron-molybdenum cofactor biosynthesis protein NifE n=1 Tax=Azospirillum oleiclasticum TaxID=2735135 RepID=A0ABX2T7P6_9PROT|nr:nitrogenase iron-molybdenum cofactor biosynthesis protein NifE [Azospirillum oleiclasticum]NYZ13231.1 nitrogenase iron-molybdenum cofactor biosynthesis protein NifE [Azospirillum oleiclasticum]NYZ20097.1 nitrogenase iron-molybdenum cofactor biosynthesis protein NifE [Azospirillum oleiclasticum]